MSIPRGFLVVVCLLVFAGRAWAQSGHWEGVIKAPETEIAIAVDLSNAGGAWSGTFTNGTRNIRDLPLSDVRVERGDVTFAVKLNAGGVFRGKLAGSAIRGVFAIQDHELPFELTRTGEARIEAAPKSAAAGEELKGRWRGTLMVDGVEREVGLRLGTANTIVSSQGLDIPITSIEQKGRSVKLVVRSIGGSFEGTLKDATIAGTWTQGAFTAPLTFRRVDAVERWAKAVGGKEKIAAIKSIYREATIEVGGHIGTLKVRHSADGTYWKEEKIATFSSVDTFDGKTATVQQGSAPARTLTGAELAIARSKAYANTNAIFFAFFPERRHGTIAIEGDDLVVMKPEGGVDWRVTLDPETSLPKTMAHEEDGRTVTVTYPAYETVNGITMEKEIRRGTGDPNREAVIRFTKTIIE